MGRSKGSCMRAPLGACAGKAEEGDMAEPWRLTTTQSRARDEWCAACDPLDLAICGRAWPCQRMGQAEARGSSRRAWTVVRERLDSTHQREARVSTMARPRPARS